MPRPAPDSPTTPLLEAGRGGVRRCPQWARSQPTVGEIRPVRRPDIEDEPDPLWAVDDDTGADENSSYGAVIANLLKVAAICVVVPELETRIPALDCRLNQPVTSAGDL